MNPTPGSDEREARSGTPRLDGRGVLVTGGLGFIGSNLTRRLVELGASVTIVDSLHPDHGGSRYNISGLEHLVRVEVADAADLSSVRPLVGGQEVVFHLAGQVSHVDSMAYPLVDLSTNAATTLVVLEACRLEGVHPRVVFTSTRQVYGRVARLPVDESCAVNPVDVNGVNKVAAEQYHRLYSDVWGIPTCVLRLTNIFGPRQLVRHARQGFVPWFVRNVLVGEEIVIYRPGTQRRDFCYVADAVEALLQAALRSASGHETFNVGGVESLTLREFTELLIRVAGRGRYRMIDYPAERHGIEIGDIIVDDRKFRAATGWRPMTGVAAGLEVMLAYYREHGHHYGLNGVR